MGGTPVVTDAVAVTVLSCAPIAAVADAVVVTGTVLRCSMTEAVADAVADTVVVFRCSMMRTVTGVVAVAVLHCATITVVSDAVAVLHCATTEEIADAGAVAVGSCTDSPPPRKMAWIMIPKSLSEQLRTVIVRLLKPVKMGLITATATASAPTTATVSLLEHPRTAPATATAPTTATATDPLNSAHRNKGNR